MRRASSRALLAALCALAGCQSGPPSIGDPPPTLEDDAAEAAYQEILQKYSDEAQLYDGFDTQLFAGATFQTWPFREAKVERLARFKALTRTEVERLLAEERAEHDQFHVFTFGAWTQDPKFDDFDTNRSIWRVALLAGEVEILPTEVVRVSRVNKNTRALYPYMGQFWVEYKATFAKTKEDGTPALPPGTREVVLQLSSTLGKARMRAAAE